MEFQLGLVSSIHAINEKCATRAVARINFLVCFACAFGAVDYLNLFSKGRTDDFCSAS